MKCFYETAKLNHGTSLYQWQNGQYCSEASRNAKKPLTTLSALKYSMQRAVNCKKNRTKFPTLKATFCFTASSSKYEWYWKPTPLLSNIKDLSLIKSISCNQGSNNVNCEPFASFSDSSFKRFSSRSFLKYAANSSDGEIATSSSEICNVLLLIKAFKVRHQGWYQKSLENKYGCNDF